MTIESALYTHLTNDSNVTELVGTRIYPLVVPQDADLPAIAYQRISGPRTHTHDGATNPAWARLQLTMVATRYSGAKALAEVVRQSLDGLAGSLGGVRAAVTLDNEVDDWAATFDAPIVRQDYGIWYEE